MVNNTTPMQSSNQVIKKAMSVTIKDMGSKRASLNNSNHSASKSWLRHITADSLFSMSSFDCEKDLPIVYNEQYNISLFGFEFLQSFDSNKYRKLSEYLDASFLDTIFARYADETDEGQKLNEAELKGTKNVRRLRYLSPRRPVSMSELKIHHSNVYVELVHKQKSILAKILDSISIYLTPHALIQTRILEPIKLQVAGTIFAAHLAIQHGWAINLGGGFHQSSFERGGFLCVFSDVLLAMKYIWRKHPLQKFMIIDLDSHQATGIERDVAVLEAKKRKLVYVLDMFNGYITPPDSLADNGIDMRVELPLYTSDDVYLQKLDASLKFAFNNFKPTLVIYIAGQDVLRNDACGMLNITDDGFLKRDEMVFTKVVEEHKCPILMLLGGGFLAHGVNVQVQSIRNLFAKGLIWGGTRSGDRSLSRPKKHFKTRDSEKIHEHQKGKSN